MKVADGLDRCPKCGAVKPMTGAFFSLRFGRVNADCKPCMADVNRADRRSEEQRAKRRRYMRERYRRLQAAVVPCGRPPPPSTAER